MKKSSKESIALSRHVTAFLNEYVPSQKTDSMHTLRSYKNALTLYLVFLETQKKIRCEDFCGSCFSRENIEEWMAWLKKDRTCSNDT